MPGRAPLPRKRRSRASSRRSRLPAISGHRLRLRTAKCTSGGRSSGFGCQMRRMTSICRNSRTLRGSVKLRSRRSTHEASTLGDECSPEVHLTVKQDAVARALRVADPPLDLDGSGGQRRPEGGGMVLDAASRRPVMSEHEQAGHRRDVPPALPCDIASDAALSVDGHEHRLHVGHDRLHLDDQERSGRWVECEDVDRSALATDIERARVKCI